MLLNILPGDLATENYPSPNVSGAGVEKPDLSRFLTEFLFFPEASAKLELLLLSVQPMPHLQGKTSWVCS